MSDKEISVNLVTDQRYHSGIGSDTYGIYQLLKDSVSMELFSMNYLKSKELEASIRPQFLLYSKVFIDAPFIKFFNKLKLKQRRLLDGKNLHLMGTDYSLVEVSDNTICTVHDFYMRLVDSYLLTHPKDLLASMYINFNNLLSIYDFKHAKELVVHSEYVRNSIKQGLGLNSTVIPIHVRPGFIPRDKQRARKLLGLPLHKHILLNVSGGGQNKNLGLLKKCIESLDEDYLLIKINAPINAKKTLNVGIVPNFDYQLYFNAADIYIHSSVNEGFGIPLIEAMASGLPVIAYAAPASKEIVARYGVLIDDSDGVEAFKSAITEMVKREEYLNYVSLSLERALFFSRERIRALWLDTYERVFS